MKDNFDILAFQNHGKQRTAPEILGRKKQATDMKISLPQAKRIIPNRRWRASQTVPQWRRRPKRARREEKNTVE
ncbi:hypothetical protein KFK09_017428 [Dendrobium nobile]|uniref:Uncharacterized protein n=1 Tax=Dendrobium nobile TaxID=94219 RepID=A0A8T3B7C5_DENNO|nr:hypothetical protein KFK09_017428 [Dendrobium nobile]